jgi:hypothetical protein
LLVNIHSDVMAFGIHHEQRKDSQMKDNHFQVRVLNSRGREVFKSTLFYDKDDADNFACILAESNFVDLQRFMVRVYDLNLMTIDSCVSAFPSLK